MVDHTKFLRADVSPIRVQKDLRDFFFFFCGSCYFLFYFVFLVVVFFVSVSASLCLPRAVVNENTVVQFNAPFRCQPAFSFRSKFLFTSGP